MADTREAAIRDPSEPADTREAGELRVGYVSPEIVRGMTFQSRLRFVACSLRMGQMYQAPLPRLPLRVCRLQVAQRPSKPTRSNVIPLTISGETYPHAQLPGFEHVTRVLCRDPSGVCRLQVARRPSKPTRSNVIPLTISGETYPHAQLPGFRICDTISLQTSGVCRFQVARRPSKPTRSNVSPSRERHTPRTAPRRTAPQAFRSARIMIVSLVVLSCVPANAMSGAAILIIFSNSSAGTGGLQWNPWY